MKATRASRDKQHTNNKNNNTIKHINKTHNKILCLVLLSLLGCRDSMASATPPKAKQQPAKPMSKGKPFPHFDTVIDLHRGGRKVWATLMVLPASTTKPSLQRVQTVSYKNKGLSVRFWPASTIKLYVATAALTLLKKMDVSLDATATFYHQKGKKWVKDTTRSFRTMIYHSITCSSNSDYTLLLRFVGVDWLNRTFLTKSNGFQRTAVMVGYVSKRPFHYKLREGQRIVIREGRRRLERKHRWSGTLYARRVQCQVAKAGGRTNCTPTADLSEHMKRLFFHEQLPASSRFDLRPKDLQWLRYGNTRPVLGALCTPGGWPGVKRVLPQARYYNKIGLVKWYDLDMAYVADPVNRVYYVLSIATKTRYNDLLIKLSEEIARMVKTPDRYVKLYNLRDGVNPIKAKLSVYSKQPTTLTLLSKPYKSSPKLPKGKKLNGWTPVPGASIRVPAGLSHHNISSQCLSHSGKQHVIARLQAPKGDAHAYSDLHYVIVRTSRRCR